MKTIEIVIRLPETHHEILIAELADLGFETFEEGVDQITAYLPAARWNDVSREQVEAWLRAVGVEDPIEERVLPDINWNEQWESTIEPVSVGPFLIKPSWHVDDGSHPIVLEIDPKMSFGTGYHESTRLALTLLPDSVKDGDRVLDAGCGTGILALAALRSGARHAIGFDIDPWAKTNAEENATRNGLEDRFEVREGSLEMVPETGFDLVLANITREVLLEMLPELVQRTAPGGRLVMAGLLQLDREQMTAAARPHGLRLTQEADENGWWAGLWQLA